MAEPVIIGVDVGGTRARVARFNRSLEIEERKETLTRSEDGVDATIGRIIELIRSVWPSDGRQVEAIGVSTPGPINPRTGVVTAPPNLKGWVNIPLIRILTDALGVEAYLGNDANLAALAETRLGAARGYKDVIFLTISTGIGSGIISDGRLLIGSRGIGDEFGHTILVVENDEVSSFEKQAAGPAIAQKARDAILKGEKSKILDMANGSVQAISSAMVARAAKEGDELALRLVARTGWYLGLGIVSLLHLFNPEIIVLGGGVIEGMGDLLISHAWETIRLRALDKLYWEDLIIAPAQLGENVSLVGAAALAMRKGQD